MEHPIYREDRTYSKNGWGDYSSVPVRYATFEILNSSLNVVHTHYLDGSGYFNRNIPSLNVGDTFYLRVVAESSAGTVGSDLGSPQKAISSPYIATGSTTPVSLTITKTAYPETRAALNILDAIIEGFLYTHARLGFEPGFEPQPVDVAMRECTTAPSCYKPAEQSIYIGPHNWDIDDVVLHEYGHFLMDDFTLHLTIPGAPHEPCVEASSAELAFSEGWAHYIAAAAKNRPYTIFQIEPNFTNWIDLEGGDTYTGYMTDNDPPCAPRLRTPKYEGCVASVLWDCRDAANELFDNISNGEDRVFQIIDVDWQSDEGSKTILDFQNAWNNSNIDPIMCEYIGTSCSTPGTPILLSPYDRETEVPIIPVLDWSDVYWATSYDVQICSDSSCSVVLGTGNVRNSQVKLSNALNNGTRYYWQVRASNAGGPGPWSSIWSFFTVPQTSPLTASAGGPYTAQKNIPVQLYGSATGGTGVYTFNWVIDSIGTKSGQNPTVTFASTGTYNATLTVTDTSLNTAQSSTSIVVSSALGGEITILQHITTKFPTSPPSCSEPPGSSDFSPQEPPYYWLNLDNVTYGAELKWVWYSPDRTVILSDPVMANFSGARCVSRQPPQALTMDGMWRVRFYYAGRFKTERDFYFLYQPGSVTLGGHASDWEVTGPYQAQARVFSSCRNIFINGEKTFNLTDYKFSQEDINNASSLRIYYRSRYQSGDEGYTSIPLVANLAETGVVDGLHLFTFAGMSNATSHAHADYQEGIIDIPKEKITNTITLKAFAPNDCNDDVYINVKDIRPELAIPCPTPESPANLYPPHGSTNIPVDADLDWTDSAAASSYDVYFGESYPLVKIAEDLEVSSYSLPTLPYNTTFDWKIVAKNNCGNSTPGPVWRFTTGAAPDTNPPDTTITGGPNGTITTNGVTFTFTGTDTITFTANLIYATYLQGYNSGWSSFSSLTSKSYSNLPNGSYTFQVKAKDEAGNEDPSPATRSFTITNTPPTANGQSVSMPKNTAKAITLTATDPDGDPLTFSIVAQPSHGSLTGSPPNVTYTPAANYTGSDSFTFKANDGKADSNVATVSITVTDAPSGGEWAVVTPPAISADWQLFDVDFSSKDDGWAVGYDASNKKGILLHYSNSAWAEVILPAVSSEWRANSIDFTSSSEGWIVGADNSTYMKGKGVLLQYSNNSWSKVTPPSVGTNWILVDTHFTSANDGWAIGYSWDTGRGGLLKYNGSWSEVKPDVMAAGYEFHAIHFSTSNEGWVIGNNAHEQKGLLLHYSNGSWVVVAPPNVSSNRWGLDGIYFINPNEGWAVGRDETNKAGVMLHYLNGSWATVALPSISSDWTVTSIHFTSSNEGWAAGSDYANNRGVLFHFLNGSWTPITPPDVSSDWELYAIHFTSPSKGWSVGYDLANKKGVLLKFASTSHCDFNGDGQADILWRNKTTGQNVVWFMDGTTYSNYAEFMQVTDTNWQIMGTGDFNGDGKTDILWRNKSTGQNVVWYMNGTTYGSYAWLLEVADLNWEIVGTGDFNGDGKIDILWRNKVTGQNVVWFMDGATYSSYAELLQVTDTNWQIVGTGDFNVDGKTDILWRNETTGQNVVWFMNGATYSSYAELMQVTDTNWQIVGTGDFNCDGKTDILWRNKTTGQNVVWFMNGITYSGYAELLKVTDSNWQIVGIFTSTIPQQYTLATSVNPSGAGTVSVNGQLYTGSLSFNSGTQVTLSASPSSGYIFSSWSGVDSSNGATAYVTMNGNRAVTANFTFPTIGLSPQNLSFNGVVGGSNPTSQNISIWNSGGGTLNWTAYKNASWLNISPTSGSSTGPVNPNTIGVSVNIAGLQPGTYGNTITISAPGASNSPQTVNVTLTLNPGCVYSLTVNVSPAGSGTVTQNPNKAAYCPGEQVTLTAVPNNGYTFSSWSDVDWSSSATAYVTMNSNWTVTAIFTQGMPPQFNLTPYQPEGWSDKIIVSKSTGTNVDDTVFYSTDTFYVDYAVRFSGGDPGGFYTQLFVDGVLKETNLMVTPMPGFTSGVFLVQDHPIGSLSPGSHAIKIVVDSTGLVQESNESDNEYTKTIMVSSQSNVITFEEFPVGWIAGERPPGHPGVCELRVDNVIFKVYSCDGSLYIGPLDNPNSLGGLDGSKALSYFMHSSYFGGIEIKLPVPSESVSFDLNRSSNGIDVIRIQTFYGGNLLEEITQSVSGTLLIKTGPFDEIHVFPKDQFYGGYFSIDNFRYEP